MKTEALRRVRVKRNGVAGDTGHILGRRKDVSAIIERACSEAELKWLLKEVIDLKAALDEHAIVAITDPQGRITYVNDKFCAISKYSREELLGQDHRIINSGFHPVEFIRDLWTTIANGEVWHGEIKNRAKDGSFYWVDTTIVPFLNEQGKPRQYVAIRADITERKRAEEAALDSEARLNFALQTSNIGAWELSLRDHTANRTAIHDRIFGYDALLPHWTYEMFLDHVLPEDRAEVDRSFRVATATNANWSLECRIRRADGEVRCIWVAGGHERDSEGKVVRMSGIVQDITERKAREAEIQQLNAELEQRVSQRTIELEGANKELEAFSYSVSHDLRAPLRAISGFSKIVLEDHSAALDADGLRYLHQVEQSARQMGQLIDDLLTFSRTGRQALVLQTVSTTDMVNACLADLQGMKENRHVTVNVGELPDCEADASLLKQVWLNLLGNALKYTRKCDQAVITIGSRREGDTDSYFVQDNGAGFEMKYADKLFGVFQRLHLADDYEGTGVGLALVQRIVQRHGGRVWAEANLNLGATFHFTLAGGRDD